MSNEELIGKLVELVIEREENIYWTGSDGGLDEEVDTISTIILNRMDNHE